MAGSEPFMVVDKIEQPRFFDDFRYRTSAKSGDLNVQLVARLRDEFPEMTITTTLASNCNLLYFAAAGYAEAVLDTDTDDAIRLKFYLPPAHRGREGGQISDYTFAKYRYTWRGEYFIVFAVQFDFDTWQYILKEPKAGETISSDSEIVNSLIVAIGAWEVKAEGIVDVYDGYWFGSRDLWNQVQESSWDNVILDTSMKKELTDVAGNFFDKKSLYDDLKVPWKRGIIFYGPAGNGKTISIKALMHTLYHRKEPIPSIYVKNARETYDIRSIFQFARRQSPCMLILEDIDTIINNRNRSYFLNELDGLENNDGILLVATTNHLDRLDAGLSKRPSRFDRKYLFDIPTETERELYCEYWKKKMGDNPIVEFPGKLCKPIAEITSGFTFAYMQELFIASLLDIAHRGEDDSSLGRNAADPTEASPDDIDEDREDLKRYRLWRAIKRTVKVLRHEIEGPEKPDEDITTSTSDSQMFAIADANANTFPASAVVEEGGEPETELVSDEQLDKMLSRLWQHENKSYFTTSPPDPAPSPSLLRRNPGSRLHPNAQPSRFLAASSHARMAKMNRPAMLGRDGGELHVPTPFALRKGGGSRAPYIRD